jgi:hypothetical protein
MRLGFSNAQRSLREKLMPKKTTLILTALASLTMADSLLAQDFLGEWRRKNTMMTDSFQFYKNGTWRESLAVVGGPDLEFPQDYIEPGHEESKGTWVVLSSLSLARFDN